MAHGLKLPKINSKLKQRVEIMRAVFDQAETQQMVALTTGREVNASEHTPP